MTLTELCRREGIPVAGPDHRHWKSNWTHLNCPFCNDRGFHLGFPDGFPGGRCFKCGKWSLPRALHRLLPNNDRKRISELVDEICRGTLPPVRKEVVEVPPVTMPRGTSILGQRAKKYLHDRGFNADQLQETWDLWCMEASGEYPWSIIIPVYDERHRSVSWQARDTTGKARERYNSCPGADLSRVLYGLHHIEDEEDGFNNILVTEGVTDAWRLGAGHAVATFGQDWSRWQLATLAKRFDKIRVVYDAAAEAQAQGEAMAGALRALGVDALNLDVGAFGVSDPGELTEEQAAELRVLAF